jgi:hypothetical protein
MRSGKAAIWEFTLLFQQLVNFVVEFLYKIVIVFPGSGAGKAGVDL